MRCAMNKALLHFEKTTGLGPTYAARLIGVAYPTYAQYRSGRRTLQRYHARHIEALLLLSRPALDRLIKEHAYG
jgi:hypothetical protein